MEFLIKTLLISSIISFLDKVIFNDIPAALSNNLSRCSSIKISLELWNLLPSQTPSPNKKHYQKQKFWLHFYEIILH